jgi:hypothetical protein
LAWAPCGPHLVRIQFREARSSWSATASGSSAKRPAYMSPPSRTTHVVTGSRSCRRAALRRGPARRPVRCGRGSPLVELDIGISFSSDASGQYPSKSGRASVRESLLFPVTARPPQRDPSGGISYSCHQLASGGLSRNVYSCAGSATDAPRIDYLRGDPSVDTLCRPVKFVPYLSRRTPATAHQRMALIS